MMTTKVEAEENIEDLSSGRLLRDIEEISRALYLHKTPSKDLFSPSGNLSKSWDIAPLRESKSNVILDNLLYKEKKSSIWNWKPLKTLTNIFNHRFSCCFFLHVHAVEGLPSNFNDLSLCVNWKRKDEVLRTRPARVSHGVAEFEESLRHLCSVYANKSGPQNSAKYEPELSLLNVSVVGAPALDIGKHWVDLTRLLPLTLEELEEEKRTSGKWITSFKLTGKAKGAVMNISFGFSLVQGKSIGPSCSINNLRRIGPPALENLEGHGRLSTSGMLRRLGTAPRKSSMLTSDPSQSTDMRVVNEMFQKEGLEFARSISFVYRKLEEEKLGDSDEFDFFRGCTGRLKSKSEHLPQVTGKSDFYDDPVFTLNEHQTEMCMKDERKLAEDAITNSEHAAVETIDIADIFKDIGAAFDEPEFLSKLKFHDDNAERSVIKDRKHAENDKRSEKSTAEEIESYSDNLLTYESEVLGSSTDTGEYVRQESHVKRTASMRKGFVRSLSLDDLTESVANDFLNMLGIEQSLQDETSTNGLESPRERLLRQFEEESLALGNSFFDFKTTDKEQIEFNDVGPTCHGRAACSDDFDLSLAIRESEEQETLTMFLRSKGDDKRPENLEMEVPMKTWGLDEKDFHHPASISSGGFGSPIYLKPKSSSCLPPLEKD